MWAGSAVRGRAVRVEEVKRFQASQHLKDGVARAAQACAAPVATRDRDQQRTRRSGRVSDVEGPCFALLQRRVVGGKQAGIDPHRAAVVGAGGDCDGVGQADHRGRGCRRDAGQGAHAALAGRAEAVGKDVGDAGVGDGWGVVALAY